MYGASYIALTAQLAARERAAMQQGQAQGLSGLGQFSPRDRWAQEALYKGKPTNKRLTFKEELQDEIDDWLRDV